MIKKAFVFLAFVILLFSFTYAEAQIAVTITDSTGKQTQNQITSMSYDGKTMALQFASPIVVTQPPMSITINGESISGGITFSGNIISSTISFPISAPISPRTRRRMQPFEVKP